MRFLATKHTSSMASTAPSLDAAERCIDEDGLVILGDSTIGESVSEMERRRFAFFTEDGLDFCQRHVLRDPVSLRKYLGGTR